MRSLSCEKYRKNTKEMEDHHQWINAASCKPGTVSPYSQGDIITGVSISAIMENFDSDKLVEFVNHVCKLAQQSWLTHRLEAYKEYSTSDIILTAREDVRNLAEDAKLACQNGTLLASSNYVFDTIEEHVICFYKELKIQITKCEPFGATTAQTVQLTARSNVPLRIMMEILHAFWLQANQRHQSLRDFGQIAIVETQGLPDSAFDHLLWCYLTVQV